MYRYVAVTGIDGMGNFCKDTETPGLDRIFENGAKTLYALSMDPTISAENWGAMLIGAAPLVHTLTNSRVSEKEYDNKELPTVFSRIRKEMPDAYLASCCNWNPINIGIVENGIGVDKRTADNDTLLMPEIKDCISKKPAFLFVQLDETDGAGHRYGYGSEKYLEAVRKADSLTDEIFAEYERNGMAEDTLFIVIADHGGYIRSHGGYTDTEKYVFFGARGKDVNKGEIKFARTVDIAATVLYALGIKVPDYNEKGFSSQLPEGIFRDTPEYIKETKAPIRKETKKTPGNFFSYFDKDKVKLLMHLDNSLKDETGKTSYREKGNVKFYSNGADSQCGEFGATGYIEAGGIDLSEGSFTLSLWLKAEPGLKSAPAVITDKSWQVKHRDDRGFTLAVRCHDIVFNIGCGDDCEEIIIPFPEGTEDGFVHNIIAFDRALCQIRFYRNFELCFTLPLKEKFLGIFGNREITIGNDKGGTYNEGSIFRADDICIFSYAFNDSDTHRLKEYYNQ